MRTRYYFAHTAIFALIFLFLIPPFENPDEVAHFFRASQVASGVLLGSRQDLRAGGELPEALLPEALKITKDIPFHGDHHLEVAELKKWYNESPPLKLHAVEQQKFLDFPNTVLYSPVPYLASGFGIFLANLFHLTIASAFYFAKFFNLIFSLCLLGASLSLLKNDRREQLILFVLLTLPMTLTQMSSLGADTFGVQISFLLFALGFRLAKNWNLRFYRIFVGLTFALSFCKMVYAPLPLFLLPILFRERRNEKWKHTAILVFAAIVPAGVWAILSKNLFVPFHTGYITNPDLQLQFFLTHPLGVTMAFLRDFVGHYNRILDSMIGHLGWLDTSLSTNIYNLYYALFILCIGIGLSVDLQSGNKWYRQKYFNLLVVAGVIYLVYLAIYLSWAEVGALEADFIQGRYFIPLTPLLFCSIPPLFRLREKNFWRWSLIVKGLLIYLSVQTVSQVFRRYWIL